LREIRKRICRERDPNWLPTISRIASLESKVRRMRESGRKESRREAEEEGEREMINDEPF
jgi:hypothetical protein